MNRDSCGAATRSCWTTRAEGAFGAPRGVEAVCAKQRGAVAHKINIVESHHVLSIVLDLGIFMDVEGLLKLASSRHGCTSSAARRSAALSFFKATGIDI